MNFITISVRIHHETRYLFHRQSPIKLSSLRDLEQMKKKKNETVSILFLDILDILTSSPSVVYTHTVAIERKGDD